MITLVFDDGPVELKKHAEAYRTVMRKLQVSRATAYRALKAGKTDFSNYRGARCFYDVDLGDDRIISAPFVEILEIARQHDPTTPKDRIYRRLTRSLITPVPLSALIAPPMTGSEIGRKGGAVIAGRKRTLFHWVEGHPDPVSARALHEEWNPPISVKGLHRRLLAGYKTKDALIAKRLYTVMTGRPETRLYSVQLNGQDVLVGTFSAILSAVRMHAPDMAERTVRYRLSQNREWPIPLSALTRQARRGRPCKRGDAT